MQKGQGYEEAENPAEERSHWCATAREEQRGKEWLSKRVEKSLSAETCKIAETCHKREQTYEDTTTNLFELI